MSYDVNNIINLNVAITPAGLSNANFAKGCLFALETELPNGFEVDTRRTYSSVTELATDFPATTETYKAGSKFLGGIPATKEIIVYGRADADTDWTTTLNKAKNVFWWYWTFVTKTILADETSVLAIAEFCNTNEIFFVNSQTDVAATAIRDPAVTNDIASQLNTLGYRTTYTFCHATDPYAGNVLAKYFAAVNYSGTNTCITGEYKKLTGVAAEDISSTAYSAMLNKKAVFYTKIDLQGSSDNGRVVNSKTHSSYGEFIDDVVNLAAFSNSIQVGLYNKIANPITKLSQDPTGQSILLSECKIIGDQYILNKYLGPRDYVDPDDGVEKYTNGYEILTEANDILDLSDSDRAERKAAPIRMRIYRVGAIHIVDINVDVY